MASANKTALGLNQWSLSDKPTMEDFNADNALLDQILTHWSSPYGLRSLDVYKRQALGALLHPAPVPPAVAL